MHGAGPNLAFWVLSALTLVAAGGVMVSRNLLHAVLFLIVSFLGVAGFFILLSAPFLGMAQIIIYVGAIAVLVLFAILLTPRAGRDNSETRWAAPGRGRRAAGSRTIRLRCRGRAGGRSARPPR